MNISEIALLPLPIAIARHIYLCKKLESVALWSAQCNHAATFL
ncbi:hypothetical protein [Microseira wollei]|nr:hypothetical protein [Microseira wollei]